MELVMSRLESSDHRALAREVDEKLKDRVRVLADCPKAARHAHRVPAPRSGHKHVATTRTMVREIDSSVRLRQTRNETDHDTRDKTKREYDDELYEYATPASRATSRQVRVPEPRLVIGDAIP